MSLKKKYLLNTGIVGISRIFENIFSYLIIVLITRNLGAEGLGQYSFLFSFVGLFFIFSDLGVTTMMVKDLSRDFSKADKYVSNVIILRLILGLASLLVYWIALQFVSKDYVLSLYLVGLVYLAYVLRPPFAHLFRIKGKGYMLLIASVLERFLALFGAYLVFSKTSNLFYFILVLLFTYSVRLVFGIIFTRSYFKFSWKFDTSFLKKLVKLGYPFMLISLFSLVYVQMDTVMLSFFSGDEVVGWYQAGYKLITMLNVIPSLVMVFGFPLMSRLFVKNKTALVGFFEKILIYLFSFMLPVIVGVWFIGDRILTFIYGISAVESFLAFKILIVAELFVFLTIIMGQSISAADKQKIFMKIAGFGALVNVGLNFLLIPKWSLYGAGIATLITYVLMFLAMSYYIKSVLFKYSVLRNFMVPMAATLIMAYVITWISSWSVILVIFISGGVYGLVLAPWIWKREFS